MHICSVSVLHCNVRITDIQTILIWQSSRAKIVSNVGPWLGKHLVQAVNALHAVSNW